MLGVDVGDVLSRRDTDSKDVLDTADPGAYAFLVLYITKNVAEGAEPALCVVTRTNAASWLTNNLQQESFVVRFIRAFGLFDMGMPEANMKICKYREDKGPLARELGCTIFIDNQLLCLLAVHQELPDCLLIQYSNTGEFDSFTKEVGETVPDSFYERLRYCQDWRMITREVVGLQFSEEEWKQLCKVGPPTAPHDADAVNYLTKMAALKRPATDAVNQSPAMAAHQPRVTTIKPVPKAKARRGQASPGGMILLKPSATISNKAIAKSSAKAQPQPEPQAQAEPKVVPPKP